MLILDGSNSLKHMATTGGRVVGDTRIFNSDYFLSCEYVNMFMNKVKLRQAQAKPDLPNSDQEESSDDDEPASGKPSLAN